MHRLLTALLLLATAATAFGQSADDFKGPLVTSNAYPLLLPFLSLEPTRAQSLAPGELHLILSTTYGNVSHMDPNFLYPDLLVYIDMEVARTNIGFDVGLPENITLGARLSLVEEFGGFFDDVIQAYHNFFHFPNGDREKYPNNQYRFQLIRNSTAMVDMQDPGFGLGDLYLTGKWTAFSVPAAGRWLALEAAVKLPTGSTERYLSNGGIDGSIGFLATIISAPFALYGRLNYLFLSELRTPKIFSFTSHSFGFFATLEWRQTSALSWLVQVEAVSSPFIDPQPWIGPPSGQLNIGFRNRVPGVGVFQASFQEEFLSFAQTDVALNLAYTYELQ
jgi:hypothetical protein